jgi:hypothetical protein
LSEITAIEKNTNAEVEGLPDLANVVPEPGGVPLAAVPEPVSSAIPVSPASVAASASSAAPATTAPGASTSPASAPRVELLPDAGDALDAWREALVAADRVPTAKNYVPIAERFVRILRSRRIARWEDLPSDILYKVFDAEKLSTPSRNSWRTCIREFLDFLRSRGVALPHIQVPPWAKPPRAPRPELAPALGPSRPAPQPTARTLPPLDDLPPLPEMPLSNAEFFSRPPREETFMPEMEPVPPAHQVPLRPAPAMQPQQMRQQQPALQAFDGYESTDNGGYSAPAMPKPRRSSRAGGDVDQYIKRGSRVRLYVVSTGENGMPPGAAMQIPHDYSMVDLRGCADLNSFIGRHLVPNYGPRPGQGPITYRAVVLLPDGTESNMADEFTMAPRMMSDDPAPISVPSRDPLVKELLSRIDSNNDQLARTVERLQDEGGARGISADGIATLIAQATAPYKEALQRLERLPEASRPSALPQVESAQTSAIADLAKTLTQAVVGLQMKPQAPAPVAPPAAAQPGVMDLFGLVMNMQQQNLVLFKDMMLSSGAKQGEEKLQELKEEIQRLRAGEDPEMKRFEKQWGFVERMAQRMGGGSDDGDDSSPVERIIGSVIEAAPKIIESVAKARLGLAAGTIGAPKLKPMQAPAQAAPTAANGEEVHYVPDATKAALARCAMRRIRPPIRWARSRSPTGCSTSCGRCRPTPIPTGRTSRCRSSSASRRSARTRRRSPPWSSTCSSACARSRSSPTRSSARSRASSSTATSRSTRRSSTSPTSRPRRSPSSPMP